MMHDDVEQLLNRLTPRGIGAELRPRVLAAVASQLEVEPPSPWLRRSALAVAASILVGIAMNVWASEVAERRLAQLFGPPPVSKQIMKLANAVEEVTDAQTAQWVYQQFAAPRPSGDGLAAYEAYSDVLRRLIDESSIISKEFYGETPKKDSQMDRDRPGRAGGDRSGCQRGVRLDYRYTA